MIENGFAHTPETAPWLAEYLHEMAVFPRGKHGDQVDSTTEAAEQRRKLPPTQPSPAPGWLAALKGWG